MKIEINYQDTDHVEITPDDLADRLSPDATDAQIEKLVREDIGEAASESPWPSYRIRSGQLEEAIAAVKKALRERES